MKTILTEQEEMALHRQMEERLKRPYKILRANGDWLDIHVRDLEVNVTNLRISVLSGE